MNKSVALKFAVSALAIGTTMVACGSPGTSRIASASSTAPKSEQQAASLYTKAQEAVRDGEFAKGLGFAERAVELSPRDVGYRMILADLYLKNGRFQSAETTLDRKSTRLNSSHGYISYAVFCLKKKKKKKNKISSIYTLIPLFKQ